VGAGKFSLRDHVQIGFEIYPDSYRMGNRGTVSGCKAAGAWTSPLTYTYCWGQERMRGAVNSTPQYAFMAWCSSTAQDKYYYVMVVM